MKKQLLTGAFLFASFLAAQAQQVLLNQTFETVADVNAQAWRVLPLDGDTNNWGIFPTANTTSTSLHTNVGFSGGVATSSNFTVANSTATPVANSDNAFETPSVALPANTSAKLTFKIGSASPTATPFAAHYSVYVFPATATASFTTVGEYVTYIATLTPVATGNYTDSSEDKTIDVSSFAGTSVKALFRHHNNVEGSVAYLYVDTVQFATTATAGVDNLAASTFSVFPNPANNVVTVANANALINAIALTDINGRTVKSVKVGGVASTDVNISDLASGVYVMSISSDKGTTTKKIVKN